jgi:hemerythrin HHE cation binding domain-containing protein
MNLIQEFHSDHQKVVNALFDLRQAIETSDVSRVRSILDSAEGLVGPHLKFEELYLYPALERFLGEYYARGLVNEHDAVIRSIRRIAQLTQKEAWSDVEHQSAMTNLELIYEHPISCDGLSLWIERLSAEKQFQLLEKMLEVRRQGTTLSEYHRERQSA